MDALHTCANAIGVQAHQLMTAGVDQVQARWLKSINACTSKDEVKALVVQLGKQGQEAMARVMSDVDRAAAVWLRDAIKQLEAPLLEELRTRYQVVTQIAAMGGETTVHLTAVGKHAAAMREAHLGVDTNTAVTDFEFEQFALGAGGALTGAAIGTMVNPRIGSAIGAAIGALAGFFMTLESLKSDCVKGVSSGLEEAKRGLGAQLASVGPLLQLRMQDALAGELSSAVARFQSWSKQVIATERGLIDQKKRQLSHVIGSSDSLVRHDRALATLQREAASVSRALCA